jgi:hypothetical protein
VERKTIVRRAALIGLGVLVTATVTTTFGGRQVRRAAAAERQAQQDWMTRVAAEDQALLDGMAQKITGLPVDPKVIAEIQAEALPPAPEPLPLRMGDGQRRQVRLRRPRGRLRPPQHRLRPEPAGHHGGQPLRHPRSVPARAPARRPADRAHQAGLPDSSPRRRGDDEWWRRYDEERNGHYGGTSFSCPAHPGAQGAIEGSLNLKAIETGRPPRTMAVSRLWRDVEGVSGGLAVVSLLWLWFLVPSWVYIDAQDRRLPRPLLWASSSSWATWSACSCT